nr:transposase [Deinococcota bacterium]
AMLSMTGRVTMLGISRWSEQGASYRTIQRFFKLTLLWYELQVNLIRHHLLDEGGYILAGDEVVVTKAGHSTFGLNRFFSSLYGHPVKGLCFFSFALVSIQQGTAYPLYAEQVVREKVASAQGKSKGKKGGKKQQAQGETPAAEEGKKPGRPKGSKNRDKRNVQLSAYLLFVSGMLGKVLKCLRPFLPLEYVVFDGAFGYNDVLQLAQRLNLSLISKLNRRSCLYEPYEGAQAKRGARRKYADKLDYQNLPLRYRLRVSSNQDVQTELYQLKALHKDFADPLNVVIIVKTNLKTGARAHVVLFSSDLSLEAERLVKYYSLRFQIEFTFRDAKGFWGLEDFMNQGRQPLHHAVNLSLFMVTLSKVLLRQAQAQGREMGVLDLKAQFRAAKYVLETLKLLPEKFDPIVEQTILTRMPNLGAIHAP